MRDDTTRDDTTTTTDEGPTARRRRLIETAADAARLFLPFVPPRYRQAVAATISAVMLLLLAFYADAPYVSPERPLYLATALLPNADLNVRVFADHLEVEPARYDRAGHAALPSWRADFFGLSVPFAPSLGWPVDGYMRPVARKERPLRVCLDELRTFDAQMGTRYAETARRAMRDAWESYLDILPIAESDCADADIVFGMGAETRNGGCGSSQAVACAALQARGGRYFTRVTLNTAMARSGAYRGDMAYWALVHEAKHAAGYGHTGEYGGEGRGHAHRSDLGFLCPNNRPCDNPDGPPAREDFEDQPGVNTLWNLRFRDAATSTPTPTPTPTPTTTLRAWAHASELSRPCPSALLYGEWCVVDLPARRVWVECPWGGCFLQVDESSFGEAETSPRVR
jgi:hypothetical protein